MYFKYREKELGFFGEMGDYRYRIGTFCYGKRRKYLKNIGDKLKDFSVKVNGFLLFRDRIV